MKTPVCIFFAILFSIASANAQKVGHINSADLLKLMPESRIADSLLKLFQDSLVKIDNSMQAEYERSTKDALGDHFGLSDSAKKIMEDNWIEMQSEMQNFENDAQNQLQDRKQQLYIPITNKITVVVKTVASENGYAYILDTNDEAIIYAYDAGDITTLVKKKLGLK